MRGSANATATSNSAFSLPCCACDFKGYQQAHASSFQYFVFEFEKKKMKKIKKDEKN
jgi:hypothetical protein